LCTNYHITVNPSHTPPCFPITVDQNALLSVPYQGIFEQRSWDKPSAGKKTAKNTLRVNPVKKPDVPQAMLIITKQEKAAEQSPRLRSWTPRLLAQENEV
jgi:hypothetical protein